MKRASFAFVACIVMLTATFFVSCSDDDKTPQNSPIVGLELPKSDAETPIQSGQTVEIKGTGFSSSCELWLQPVATRADAEAVKVDVTLTATGISFVVPALSGKYDVVLKQDGQSYTLGNLILAKSQKEHLFAVSVDKDAEPTTITFHEYDSAKDEFAVFDTFEGYFWKMVLPGENGVIYYFKDGGLFSYDLNNKTEKRLLDEHWLAKMDEYVTGTGQAIGMIGGKLHGVKYSQKEGFTVVSIGDDGKETVVKTFPAFAAANGSGNADFFCEDDNLLFRYDEVTQTIVLSGWQESGDPERETYATIISLNMKDATVHPLWDKEVEWYSCLKVDGKFWLASLDSENISTIEQVELPTWKRGQKISGLEEQDFYNPVYSKSSNAIYWGSFGVASEGDNLMEYNVATGKVTTKAGLPYIDCVFVAEY